MPTIFELAYFFSNFNHAIILFYFASAGESSLYAVDKLTILTKKFINKSIYFIVHKFESNIVK